MSNACIPPKSLYNCPPNPLVTIISLLQFKAGADPGGGDRLPKTYESNFIHHDFVQFRKKHSRYKAILPSIVLSQQCCEICFISLTVSEAANETGLPHITEIAPPKLTDWIRPWFKATQQMDQSMFFCFQLFYCRILLLCVFVLVHPQRKFSDKA